MAAMTDGRFKLSVSPSMRCDGCLEGGRTCLLVDTPTAGGGWTTRLTVCHRCLRDLLSRVMSHVMGLMNLFGLSSGGDEEQR